MALTAIVEIRTRTRHASGELTTDDVVELRRSEGDTIALQHANTRASFTLDVRAVTTERVILVCGDARHDLAIGERARIASPDDALDFASWELRLVAVRSVDARTMPGGSELERALLAAVRATPDDDAPRLVYADWLLSQPAQADRDRGELVQIQCALVNVPVRDRSGTPIVDRRRALRERERELLAALPVPRFADPIRLALVYTRGFLETCRGELGDFANHAVSVFQLAPELATLELDCATMPNRGTLDRLATVGELGQIRELSLGPTPGTLGGVADAFVEAIAPRMASLRRLKIARLRLGVNGVAAVVAGPAAPQLAMLDLSGNRLAGDGTRRLVAATQLQPAVVRLAACDLTQYDVVELSKAPWLTEVEELDLCDNPLTIVGVSSLASVAFRRLRRLALASCGLHDAAALLRSNYLARLTHVRLHKNAIGDAALFALARSRARSIAELDMQGCEIGDAGIIELAATPNVRAARRWRLGGNAIGDAGARAIAESHHLGDLVELDVVGCPIGDAGAAALADSGLSILRISAEHLSPEMRDRLRMRFGDTAVV